MDKGVKRAGIILGGAVAISIIIIAIFSLSVARERFPADHLIVEGTYLLKTGETNTSVNVTCIPYLTNIWKKESGEIKVVVYVIETANNIADYRNIVEVGKIGAETTKEIEIPLKVSEDTYRVEMLIFENEKLVLKGRVSLSVYPIYRYINNEKILDAWSVSYEDKGFSCVN